MSARRSLPPLALAAACLAATGCGATGTGSTADGGATGGVGTAATSVTTAIPAAATTAAATTTSPSPTTPAVATTTTRACGRIAVPGTEARATVTLRGASLACTTVRRVVRTAYGRTVLVAAPWTTVRVAGRTFRCRYTASSGAMVCDAPGRRLRGTI